MPLGEGYTVKEQLTGRAEIGGLQFDFFHHLSDDVLFSEERTTQSLDLYKAPFDLGINSILVMKHRYVQLSSLAAFLLHYCHFVFRPKTTDANEMSPLGGVTQSSGESASLDPIDITCWRATQL